MTSDGRVFDKSELRRSFQSTIVGADPHPSLPPFARNHYSNSGQSRHPPTPTPHPTLYVNISADWTGRGTEAGTIGFRSKQVVERLQVRVAAAGTSAGEGAVQGRLGWQWRIPGDIHLNEAPICALCRPIQACQALGTYNRSLGTCGAPNCAGRHLGGTELHRGPSRHRPCQSNCRGPLGAT